VSAKLTVLVLIAALAGAAVMAAAAFAVWLTVRIVNRREPIDWEIVATGWIAGLMLVVGMSPLILFAWLGWEFLSAIDLDGFHR
jgi:hypothetical protein